MCFETVYLYAISMRRSLLVTLPQILLCRPYEQQELLKYALSFAKKITSQPSFGLLCLSPRLWAVYKVSLFRPPIGLLHKYGDIGGLVSYVHCTPEILLHAKGLQKGSKTLMSRLTFSFTDLTFGTRCI